MYLVCWGLVWFIDLEGDVTPRHAMVLRRISPLSRSIRSIECRLFTKIITRMNQKLRDESIKSN
jgi:hypothetical protein